MVQSQNEAYKTLQKLSQIHGQIKGAWHHRPSTEYGGTDEQTDRRIVGVQCVMHCSRMRILRFLKTSRIFTNFKTWNELYIIIHLFYFCILKTFSDFC